MSVQHLKRGVAAYIKRLEEVRGIRQHTEGNNLVLYTELIKLRYSVAAVTV
jgi:hypothetical protein